MTKNNINQKYERSQKQTTFKLEISASFTKHSSRVNPNLVDILDLNMT